MKQNEVEIKEKKKSMQNIGRKIWMEETIWKLC